MLKLSILAEFPRKGNWLIIHKAATTVTCNRVSALACITAYRFFVCLFWLFYAKEGQALNYPEVLLELRGPEGLKSIH